VIAIFFLLWLPADIYWLKAQGNQTLQQDRDAREWITTLGKFAKRQPAVTGFVYQGMPETLHIWGVEAGVKYFFRLLTVTVPSVDSPQGAQLLRNGRVAILSWDAARHRLEIQTP
jgi:hypothetical protein